MKKELPVEIPSTANFIKVGKEYIPLSDFSEAELREIGKKWTEKLLEKRSQRLKELGF